MKKIINLVYVAFLLVALVSCDGWNDPESIGIEKNTIDKTDPELYARYLLALKKYKASDHKITYVTFENVEVARNQSHHLSAIPDSIDYVEIFAPDKVANWLNVEISQLREQKGMRFIARLSQVEIKVQWEALQSSFNSEDEQTEETYENFELTSINAFFDRIDAQHYDGVCIAYSGSYTEQMTETEKTAYIAAQENFLAPIRAWIAANPDKVIFFEGSPQFVENRELIEAADYVILPTRYAKSVANLTMTALQATRDETLKSCKFLFSVETLPYDEADVNTGRYDGGFQIEQASDWTTQVDSFNKEGLVIWNVQRDYFNSLRIFGSVRNAIKTMNPNA